VSKRGDPRLSVGDRVDGGLNNRGDKRIVGEVVAVDRKRGEATVRLDEYHRSPDNCGGYSYLEATYSAAHLRVIDTRETRAEARGAAKERMRFRPLVEAVEKLRAARDERRANVVALQRAAAEARRTGRAGRAPDTINVFDIGDVTDEICDALSALGLP